MDFVNSSSLTLVLNLCKFNIELSWYIPSFLCLTRQREKGEKSYVPAPLVRENINSTTGQELESLHYTRATEKVTAAKNVGKILFRRGGRGKESTFLVGMHK